MPDNFNKFFVLFASLFLFGCATQSPPIKPVQEQTIIAPCYPATAKQFLRWNKANGKELRGLTKRRQEEMNLFLTGCKNV